MKTAVVSLGWHNVPNEVRQSIMTECNRKFTEGCFSPLMVGNEDIMHDQSEADPLIKCFGGVHRVEKGSRGAWIPHYRPLGIY